MLSQQDAINASEPGTPTARDVDAPAVGQRSLLRRVFMWALASIACCALGMLIGVGLDRRVPPMQRHPPQPTVASIAFVAESAAPALDALQGQPPQQAMQRGDRLLADADVIGAARVFEALKERYPNSVTDELRYRLAICAEAFGDGDQAVAAYRHLARLPRNTPMGLAARLGQARVWIRLGRLDTAKSLLCSLRLVAGQYDANEAIHAEIAHGLAQIHLYEIHQRLSDDLLLDLTIAAPGWNWQPEDGLKVFSNAAAAAIAAPEAGPPKMEILRRYGDAPEDIQVSAIANRHNLTEVFEQIAEKTGLKFKWSDSAKLIAAARSAEITLPGVNLADLLDDLLDSIGLVWTHRNGELVIQTQREILEEEFFEYKQAVAERAARDAVAQFPDDGQAAASYLALGNVAFVHRNWSDARNFYEQSLRLYPRSAFRSETWFNYAKTLLQTGEAKAARRAMLRVVDEGQGHPLEAIAYLYVGRLTLDTGNYADAVTPLSRAVAAMKDVQQLPTAVLTLAAAYLLDDRSGAAIAVLMNHREALNRTPYHNAAAFLTAMARYKSAFTEADSIRAGRDLVSAVTNVVRSDFFGHHGYVLLANAFEQLGLDGDMESTYQQALDANMSGPLRDRILLRLADFRRQSGRINEARAGLQLLATEGGPAWQRVARLTLAEIDYQEGNDKECLETCRKLIQDCESTTEQRQVLKLMGRVYQRQAEHYRAAICFAGMLPQNEEINRDDVVQ